MERKEVIQAIEEKIKPLKEMIDVLFDVPVLAAQIYTDVKDILKAMDKTEKEWEIIKERQKSLQKKMAQLQKKNEEMMHINRTIKMNGVN